MEDLNAREFLRELKASPRPIYVLLSPSEYLVEKEGLAPFIEALAPKETRDFDLEILDGGERRAEKILQAAQTLPFMAPRKAVAVRRAHLLTGDQWDILAPLLGSPPARASVAFGFAGAKKDLPSALKKLPDEAALVNLGSLKGKRAISWLRDRAKREGKTLTEEAAQLIVLLVGEEPALMASELEKCLMFAGEKETVGVDEVQEAVGDVRVHDVFELTSKVGAKDGPAAVDVLRRLLASGGTPGAILGILNWYLENLWLAREAIEGRITEKRMRSLVKPSFKAGEYKGHARGFTLDGLADGFETLLMADLALKSTPTPPGLVLERAVLRLTGRGR